MIKPMTRMQKIFAYTTLVIILGWTAFGLHAIWLILTYDH